MTIADALRRVAPPAAADTEDETRVRAMALEVVYTELHRLARTRVRERSEAEDIASSLAYAIAAAGPRDPDRCPASDGQARAYLWTAIRNRMVDRHRVARREHGDEDLDRFEGAVDPTGEADVDAQLALVVEAQRVLYDEAVPAIAQETQGRFDREGFVTAVQQMRALHQRSLSLDALLVEIDGQVSSAGRNRLYKQHERARTRLLDALPAWLERRRLGEPLDTIVRRLAATELAARVTRGAGA
jgi:DNA-directed RNA polymerase specialized sigma24 family protein